MRAVDKNAKRVRTVSCTSHETKRTNHPQPPTTDKAQHWRIGKAQGTPAANNMHLPRVAKWGEKETGQSRAAGEELPIRNLCTRGGRGQQRRIVKSLEIRCANTTRQQLPQHAVYGGWLVSPIEESEWGSEYIYLECNAISLCEYCGVEKEECKKGLSKTPL